jgi:RES domain-containing protein
VVHPPLVAAIDALELVALEGRAFRHIAANRNPLSGAGARSQGGRWNPPESFATLYLGLARQTAVDEFYRLARRSNRAPGDFLPRHFYRYEFRLGALVDLRDEESQAALGLSPGELLGNDLTTCQAIGEAAHYLGREGIVAPSAAGAGQVLAVFSDRLAAGSYVHDVDYEIWELPP